MNAVKPGNVIFLNGTSSSGKTSIVRALQETLEEPYLDAGIDKFLWMLPKRYIHEPACWQQIFRYDWHGEVGKSSFNIVTGDLGKQLISGMHRAVAQLSLGGSHAIVDHVMLEPAWLEECARLFAELPAWLIGVRCPLEVLEEREMSRKDRTLGQARAQFHRVHAGAIYDLEVDTSLLSPAECAAKIQNHIAGCAPRAFQYLARQFGQSAN